MSRISVKFLSISKFLQLFFFIFINGVPVKDIQIWLGHSNFQTTLRYAHADIENKRISASVISDKLALDTKDTKKRTNYRTCTLGNLFYKIHF